MKQIVQSYKTGEVKLREVPVPRCDSKRILVRTAKSLISIGTERSVIDLGRKSLAGKAAARPDLVRRAWEKAKKEGLLKTYQEAMGRLDTPTPLGYSCAGVVEECGLAATEFSPGDRVACIGQGFASHAEFVSIPINLTCRIPEDVSEEEATFGMLGIIALHGIRCADLSFGSRVVVMGLGLIGLLTVQMLQAYGCEVIAFDPDKVKVELSKQLGLKNVTSKPIELQHLTNSLSQAQGVDAVIITAATKKSDPVDQAIQLCRSKGKIVMVGVADIHPDRNELWQKEVELVVSRVAGPGSLDPLYELEGIDLPIGDVRWTQKRNLEEFLRLLQCKKVNVQPLITHRFPIADAELAYSQLIAGKLNKPVGVLLEYMKDAPIHRNLSLADVIKPATSHQGAVNLGVIGAGLFGKALLLPALQKIPEVCLHTLVTSSGANVEHSGRKFGFLNQATDAEQIWSNPDIQGVVGLTPHSHHATLVQSALKNKKSLFLEKPLCTTVEELIELRKIAEKVESLPLLLVGHNRSFSPHTKKMQTWLQSRRAPLVVHMRINSGFVPATHWVHSEDEGRSRIIGEMSHFIDLLQSLTGEHTTRVYAERISGDNKFAVNNDNIVIAMKFTDGSVGNLTYSASGDKAYSRELLEIFFDGKTIVSQDFSVSRLHGTGKTVVFKTRGQEMGYVEELKHFTNCVAGKKTLLFGLEEIFATMETIFAIERSLSTANAVSLEKS
ncbi:MAG: bi-domain-containing oxidoreductase [Candidatus Poribacteria bacterium]|nr:bi-domain-containing oxidoreductase [Candidatus Poribacteria bacterium]